MLGDELPRKSKLRGDVSADGIPIAPGLFIFRQDSARVGCHSMLPAFGWVDEGDALPDTVGK